MRREHVVRTGVIERIPGFQTLGARGSAQRCVRRHEDRSGKRGTARSAVEEERHRHRVPRSSMMISDNGGTAPMARRKAA